jgi:hypothetical protein
MARRIALDGIAEGAALATGAMTPTEMTEIKRAAMTLLTRIRILRICNSCEGCVFNVEVSTSIRRSLPDTMTISDYF